MSASAHEQRMQHARKDIQGIILSGYGHLPCVRYLFLEFSDATGVRRWLSGIVPQITTGEEWRGQDGTKQKPVTAMHVAFSYSGLTKLDLPEDTLASFPPPFVQGIATRAG